MANSVFLNVGIGGSISGQTAGDLIYAVDASTLGVIPDVATGQVLASGGVATIPAYTATPTVTTLTSSRTALATTSTDGLVALNATAATSGATVQISPRIRLRGNAWDTAASETVDFFMENLPATAATPTGTLKFGYSLNGAAATYPMTLTSAGVLTSVGMTATGTVQGDLVSGVSQIKVGASAPLYWDTRTVFRAPGNGSMTLKNNGETGGILIGTAIDTLNGQSFNAFQTLTELTVIAAAATTDTTIQMPATAVVFGVSVRVTTVIPTAATFTVGDSGSAARFSTAAVSVAATSTDPGTKAGAYYNASALSVRITPDVQPLANTGRVRVTIYYYTVTPPTS